jgi:glucose-1-phosphate thymidylyltransferase
MYPLTEHFPKPLLPVADRPVIDYLMDQLSELPQLSAVHVITNDRFFPHFDKWRGHWLQSNDSSSLAIEIHNDGATTNDNRLGAAADLQLVLEKIGEPARMLVSAGDNIYRFELASLWERFLQGNHHFITALQETDESRLRKSGVLQLGDDDRVLRLDEKPSKPPSNWLCPPLYFFQPSVTNYLNSFLTTSESRDAPGHFIAWLCRQEPVYAFRLTSSRLDIGSIDTYRQADRLLRQKPA